MHADAMQLITLLVIYFFMAGNACKPHPCFHFIYLYIFFAHHDPTHAFQTNKAKL